VLHLNKFPTGWARWVFANVFLCFSQRSDGLGAAVLVLKEAPSVDLGLIEEVLGAFQTLPVPTTRGDEGT